RSSHRVAEALFSEHAARFPALITFRNRRSRLTIIEREIECLYPTETGVRSTSCRSCDRPTYRNGGPAMPPPLHRRTMLQIGGVLSGALLAEATGLVRLLPRIAMA